MAPQALPPELHRLPFRATYSPEDKEWLDQHIGAGKRWTTTTDYLNETFLVMRRFVKAMDRYAIEFIDAEARRAAANR